MVRLWVFALTIVLVGACAPAATPTPGAKVSGEVVVFAASSLTDAFQEIGTSFQQANPNVKVTFNFGASSQLATQLGQGASADVFASAGTDDKDFHVVAPNLRISIHQTDLRLQPSSRHWGLKCVAGSSRRIICAWIGTRVRYAVAPVRLRLPLTRAPASWRLGWATCPYALDAPAQDS